MSKVVQRSVHGSSERRMAVFSSNILFRLYRACISGLHGCAPVVLYFFVSTQECIVAHECIHAFLDLMPWVRMLVLTYLYMCTYVDLCICKYTDGTEYSTCLFQSRSHCCPGAELAVMLRNGW